MKMTLAILTFLGVLPIGAALADDDCFVPMADWQPREAVARLASSMPYAVLVCGLRGWRSANSPFRISNGGGGQPGMWRSTGMTDETPPTTA